ncbi:carbohydrate ABC transporter permease [Paenibacillus qinlingensis]|uniref:Aldouronate transport system permease protein n=1 Tax=Paenibacillus qinlingensis TaxID=1837343 RepID=A0ABU1P386_9BACL|nr:carbohydrate ABC transporter permease [Paenibacillus qinlingensis]MDR6554203.1 putative aldouronate transport system permease protein [Paenibacillus qinlingensis]
MSEAMTVRKQQQRIAKKRGPNDLSPTANMLVNVFFWIYTAACIMPLILVIIVSFSDEKGVLIHGYNFIPEAWSLEAYKFMFKDWHQILRSFGISVFLATVGTAISLVMMSLYAYPISRSDFPHKSFFSFFMFFTMLFNGGLVPWYLVYTQMLDLKNTIAALMLPLLVSAFFVLLLRTFFANSIPMPLIEAAKIDGAGEIRIFSQIIIPLSLPVLASVGLFQVLNYWNDWFLSLVFISGSKNINLQFMMYKTMLDIQFLTSNVQASQGLSQAGGMLQLPTETVRMAMAVLGIGPIVFAYPFFQKYFKKGLTVGAIKG